MTRSSDAILGAVHGLIAGEPRLVLAVSGGVDSMSLLDVVARVHPRLDSVVVATFDHGTGDHASRAVRLVEAEAESRGFAIRVGRARLSGASEAAWRTARLRFFRSVAEDLDAVIVTGHTRDDHLETIVMRVLRGAGVRGIAGLLPEARARRPLLAFSRGDIEKYARRFGVRWIDDPTNQDRRFFRNRVRLELLPAMLAARPQLTGELLTLAREANAVRQAIDRLASQLVVERNRGEFELAAEVLDLGEIDSRLLWQSVLAVTGTQTDWRGIQRLARFGRTGRVGTRCQLSGDQEVWREREAFVVRSHPPTGKERATSQTLDGELTFGDWRFLQVEKASIRELEDNPWLAAFPTGTELVVRAWKSGDRMSIDTNGGVRRVKRFFADAHIAGPRRAGWPIVVANGSVVWIPGIRRSPLLSRTLSSFSIIYRCERQPG